MIRNFFTVAFRNFLRQKLYSLINIGGLAAGLTCALFIYLWVRDEVLKDKFHRDSEKIFQILSNLELQEGEVITWNTTPGPLADDIRENSPEVEMAVRTQGQGPQLFQYGDKSFMETGLFADPDFFRLFSFEIIKGKPGTDASDISSISISENLARKLFTGEDPIGKVVKVNEQHDYTIVAVFQNLPVESSIQFDYVLPFEVFKKQRGGGYSWGNYDHPLYVKLTDPAQADQAIKRINERRANALKGTDESDNVDFYIMPFEDYYLHSHFQNGKPIGGRIGYVQTFSVVAVFILVIACINFMNMATAKAATRSKEVGIRKVVGAERKSLIFQFISESVLITSVAMLVALGLVMILLPLFNMLVEKQIAMRLTDPLLVLAIIGSVVTTGFFAGSYPALYLSSYQPAQVLKGTLATGRNAGSLRKALVVFQFSLTVILTISCLVMYTQIQYILTKDLGYDRSSILSVAGHGNIFKAFENFQNDALQYPAIKMVSKSNESLVQVNNQNSSVSWPGKPDNSNVFFRTVVVDYGFLETMGLELKEGRFFSKEFNDTSNFILTKRAIEVMGLTDPVGQTILQWDNTGKIVGIVDDFHSRSMYEAIDPVVFMCKPEWTNRIFIRFDRSKTSETIAHLESIYKKYTSEYPFSYSFVEDDFEKLYNNEKVTASLGLGFTLMAIIISGLGLLGLAAYTAEQRKKEIGIRKTMGASVAAIVLMLSHEFIRLSFIAVIIGCPIAYFLMKEFLAAYAYSTDLNWQVFVLPCLIVMLASLLTVIFQVTRAALANPVDALRNE